MNTQGEGTLTGDDGRVRLDTSLDKSDASTIN